MPNYGVYLRLQLKMMNKVIHVRNVVARLPELRFQEPINWIINEGEQWVLIGPNGGGKSLLADMLLRKHAIKEGEIDFGTYGKINEWVKSISFKDIYSLADYRNSYYQQRWHATETDEVPFVSELLTEQTGEEELSELLRFFDIEELLSKRLIFLSSGELRKFLIVRALLNRPRLLILDNPFIGLDAASRQLLTDMLEQMTALKSVQVVLLLSNPHDIPDMITHVLPVYNKRCFPVQTQEEFFRDKAQMAVLFPSENNELKSEIDLIVLPVDEQKKPSSHQITLRMDKVSIRYGIRTILDELDWEVRNGEKWTLFGPNGSGKSTLLSLVYADNPQAYANTFYLFDRKRGTGESIWDIKKRIGYVSPEMHLFYHQNVPSIQIVGSGFFDSIGLHRSCNTEQQILAEKWMDVFGIRHLAQRLFLTLSSGEQRLVLLARAFVKDPDLLILDEPLHGLDINNKKKVAQIIEKFGNRQGKTLIYVTHYPHELPPSVDKQFLLQKQSEK